MSNPSGRSLCVALLAVLVSLASLGLSILTSREQAAFNKRQIEHNHLSLTPILSFERILVPDPNHPFIGLYLHNAGEGVAKDFTLTVRVTDLGELGITASQPEQQDPMFGLRQLLKDLYPGAPQMVARGGVPGALEARSTLFMLGILAEDYDAEWVAAFQQLMSHVEITISYRSLYEDEFQQDFGFTAL